MIQFHSFLLCHVKVKERRMSQRKQNRKAKPNWLMTKMTANLPISICFQSVINLIWNSFPFDSDCNLPRKSVLAFLLVAHIASKCHYKNKNTENASCYTIIKLFIRAADGIKKKKINYVIIVYHCVCDDLMQLPGNQRVQIVMYGLRLHWIKFKINAEQTV